MAHKAFGRRDNPNRRIAVQPQAPCPPEDALPVRTVSIERVPESEAPDVDEELRAWKIERSRTRPFQVAWGPLSLMASLCFGIASFVLPDSLNDNFGTLLDVLSALAFFAWLAKFLRQRKTVS